MDTCEYGLIDENKTKHASRIKPFWKQIFLCSGAWNLGFCLGMSKGTNTVAIPQMINENIEVSDEMRSWLGSAYGFGCVIWLIILTPFLHRYGVKKSYLGIYIAPIIGSIVIYFAKSSTQYLCGQALQTLMATSMTSVTIMILTEYISPENRSFALFLKTASLYWGIWTANTMGTFFYWRYISIMEIVCALYGLTVFFWPESPYWLASKGRMNECADSFRWARGVNEETEQELRKLIEFHKNNREETKKSLKENFRNFLKWLVSKEFYMPMFLCCLVAFLYLASGKSTCTMYAVELLHDMTSDSKWIYSAMLILDGVNVLGMYCGSYLVKRCDQRRTLFILSGIGITCLFMLSIQKILSQRDVIQNDFRVSLAILIVYSLAVCTGPMMLAAAFVGALFPIKNRLVFGMLFTTLSQISYGTLMKVSPFMFKWGLHVVFSIYACLSLVICVLLYFLLPDTQGKTSIEICEYFNNSKKKTDESKAKVEHRLAESLLTS